MRAVIAMLVLSVFSFTAYADNGTPLLNKVIERINVMRAMQHLPETMKKTVTDTDSVAIIVLNDEYTDSDGSKSAWMNDHPRIKVESNGYVFKQKIIGYTTGIACALPSICIIENFPTAPEYYVRGYIRSTKNATVPVRFSDLSVCEYNERCPLITNDKVQGYIWIREKRDSQCVSRQEGESYYDVMAALALATASNTKQPVALFENLKKGMNDGQIYSSLKNYSNDMLDIVLFAIEKTVGIKGKSPSKLMDFANKVNDEVVFKSFFENLQTLTYSVKNYESTFLNVIRSVEINNCR
jgi:hypothetical protein